jgi:hypothetical protein
MTSSPPWTTDQLRAQLDIYEQELRAAGKARNTVTTYVQHPERFLNWLDGTYAPQRSAPVRDDTGGTSRYQPLMTFLEDRSEEVVRMTFSEIEGVLGAALPASARRYRPWWANERDGTHVHARAWMAAGRTTANVDLNEETVDFVT